MRSRTWPTTDREALQLIGRAWGPRRAADRVPAWLLPLSPEAREVVLQESTHETGNNTR